MRKTEIAIAKPFEGAPRINLASVYGASPEKPFLLRIPATGQRPMRFCAAGLPEGLELKENIITGRVKHAGDYPVTLTAENALGVCEKRLTLEIRENHVLLTPLMGFTSWNAFESTVSQEMMTRTAQRMVDLGVSEYGYAYVNTDSGWQKEYGGEFDAIMPNEKFPDMKKMCDDIHTLGLKCGIYATPMLTAWGCPREFASIPGCTQGAADDRFARTNGGIGVIRKEKNNARQWAAWGFDYLKYDWAPTDPVNAELMRQELVATERDFGFCVTVMAMEPYAHYYAKHCNSYRANPDAHGQWPNLLAIYASHEKFGANVCKGHFFDLDMLDVGDGQYPEHENDASRFALTQDEQIVSFTMRAFFQSPLQISSSMEHISEFELSLYGNEEIIALNQDAAFDPARRLTAQEEAIGIEGVHIYERTLEDGAKAIAVFNMGETQACFDVTSEARAPWRDVWAKKDLGKRSAMTLDMAPHTVRVLRVG